MRTASALLKKPTIKTIKNTNARYFIHLRSLSANSYLGLLGWGGGMSVMGRCESLRGESKRLCL